MAVVLEPLKTAVDRIARTGSNITAIRRPRAKKPESAHRFSSAVEFLQDCPWETPPDRIAG